MVMPAAELFFLGFEEEQKPKTIVSIVQSLGTGFGEEISDLVLHFPYKEKQSSQVFHQPGVVGKSQSSKKVEGIT